MPPAPCPHQPNDKPQSVIPPVLNLKKQRFGGGAGLNPCGKGPSIDVNDHKAASLATSQHGWLPHSYTDGSFLQFPFPDFVPSTSREPPMQMEQNRIQMAVQSS